MVTNEAFGDFVDRENSHRGPVSDAFKVGFLSALLASVVNGDLSVDQLLVMVAEGA